MELWIDAIDHNYNDFIQHADRIWKGVSPDVAEVELDGYKGQEEAISLIGIAPWILIRCSNWKMIPLENLIAKSLGSGTKIAISISSKIDIGGAAFALQHGVDALLMPPIEEMWRESIGIREGKEKIHFSEDEIENELSKAKIVVIESGGFGERVCIDLIERLDMGEGMLLGSVAELLCLIHGETIPSQYVPSRPFRVNAGAVHSYVLMNDGKTKYLSELIAGDKVAIINSRGGQRCATIGRVKIERRPFLKIEYECGKFEGNIILQQAETVRIVSNSKGVRSVTDLEIGDEILVLIDQRMRHMGTALKGDMSEK
jgi:3-dehydroquinate synthase II